MGIFDFFKTNWKKRLRSLQENVLRAMDRFRTVEDDNSVQFCNMILAKTEACRTENQFKIIESEWKKFYKTHYVENDTGGIIYRPGATNYRSSTATDILYTGTNIADIIGSGNSSSDSGANIDKSSNDKVSTGEGEFGGGGNSSTWTESTSDNS